MNWVVSDTTLRARRNEWIEAGVFDALMAEALAAYDKIIGIDTSDVMIDGSNKLAPCGGEKAAAGPGQKGRKGWKWCVAVDRDGIPLAWTIDGANRNDYKMLTPTLDAYFGVDASLPIGTLHLDRGFGYKTIGEKLADYPVGDLNVLWRRDPNEGRVKLVGFGRRWVVERTNSWLCSNGQLRRNTDRKAAHRHAAMCLAAAFIIVTKLVQHRTANCVPIR